MTLLQLVLILSTVFLLSVGQLLFKLASADIILSYPEILRSLINFKLMIALVIYAIATLLWIITLKELPLRVAYSFVGMAFFVVPILAHFVLGETLSWNTFAGAGIIAVGVLVSVAR
jgi:undecaprenyl phosphate-alpha-L-ara4N flippase subunit ArnE